MSSAVSVSVYVFDTEDGVVVELDGGTGNNDGFYDMFGDDISSIVYTDTDTNEIWRYYTAPNWDLTEEELAAWDDPPQGQRHLFRNMSVIWNQGGVDNLVVTLNGKSVTYTRGPNGDVRTVVQYQI